MTVKSISSSFRCSLIKAWVSFPWRLLPLYGGLALGQAPLMATKWLPCLLASHLHMTRVNERELLSQNTPPKVFFYPPWPELSHTLPPVIITVHWNWDFADEP